MLICWVAPAALARCTGAALRAAPSRWARREAVRLNPAERRSGSLVAWRCATGCGGCGDCGDHSGRGVASVVAGCVSAGRWGAVALGATSVLTRPA
ncbi:hypothetical protein, partial [Kineococcus esterisolvens]|uniref:hypothetical protein n=1 Tax=Kineococcus sp. SYSU DK016 TaxID=3383137 RepID=UPI003D7DB01B